MHGDSFTELALVESVYEVDGCTMTPLSTILALRGQIALTAILESCAYEWALLCSLCRRRSNQQSLSRLMASSSQPSLTACACLCCLLQPLLLM
jgi:hypothetical protein